MKARVLTALGALMVASACGEPPAPAIVAPVQTAPAAAPVAASTVTPPTAASTPSSSAPSPSASSSSPSPPTAAEPTPALAPPMGPNCKTINDCWMDDDRKPITRPAKFRGKVIRPCKDGEHAPACADGMCIVRHFKC